MAAITTLSAHTNRVREFFYKDDIYFGIAKSTPWEDPSDTNISDTNPPIPEFDTTELNEVIGFKKAEQVLIVVPDDTGEIVYQDTQWRIVSPEDAFKEKARHIFLSTTIRYDELPLGKYRQVGVFVGLKPKEGIPAGQYNLLPSEVQDIGVLEVVDNRQDSNRQADQKETLNIVIKL